MRFLVGVFAGLGLALLTAATAFAQDTFSGVQLGDRFDEAFSALGGEGRVQTAPVTGGWGDQILWNDGGFTVQTCQGSVVWASQELAGGFHEFNRLVETESRRGEPRLLVGNSLSDQGEHSSLRASWLGEASSYSVVLYGADGEPLRLMIEILSNDVCSTELTQ